MVQVLVVRVDTGVVIYEAVTLQSWRSVVQVLVVRVDIGVVIYETVTPIRESQRFLHRHKFDLVEASSAKVE